MLVLGILCLYTKWCPLTTAPIFSSLTSQRLFRFDWLKWPLDLLDLFDLFQGADSRLGHSPWQRHAAPVRVRPQVCWLIVKTSVTTNKFNFVILQSLRGLVPGLFRTQLIRDSLFTEYETDSLPKRRSCSVENQINGPRFSSFKLVLVAWSEIEVKNFTNPGLA